ncbi:sugar transferase [Achromobacter xylosoxidans]|uniref:sugar transferase n=1 Tax=Alcaligenes xylosoxydans xylosoxydans TaxID=85698 RepID=UPI0001F43252|nr:sugar transferase [Achromobacter xylosoxidans]AXA79984.1 undecaprenyl-phosphate glucose phosphotransferase [Achromobacter xylosoxidans]EFV82108.1 BplG protein [Achromobacter xylosoxidans C54]KAA5922468.1 sugar transferase [Achromobacter xylosoxidans]MCZ8441350.1 sugar transferase [Achromobacter xylosoxidans]MDC6162761.1 sugar transferase [Achromobacter xylosoxidans]
MKRLFDFVVSLLGLIVLSPLFLVIAVAIKRDSPGPVFFRQVRVGKDGRTFRIHKFRSMTVSTAGNSKEITVGGDARITRTGAWIRHWKLDELPQLIDVLAGSMSVVGPRPEVPRYVALYPDAQRRVVLSVKPGITDLASIQFRHENELLARASDPEQAYREQILPEKLRLQSEYVRTRSFIGDMKILVATFAAIFRR